MGPEGNFFSGKPLHQTSLIFPVKLQQRKGLKLSKMILWGKILWKGFRQQWLKISFLSFTTN